MVRPRFVTKVVKNGETLKEFPVEVMRPQIAKEKSIKELQTILEQVVSMGLGFGRLGNFIGAELWGKTTDGSWGVVFPHSLPAEMAQLSPEALRSLTHLLNKNFSG